MWKSLLLLGVLGMLVLPSLSAGTSPSFADFHRRAAKGERLTVVFFGASLTWGANSSDPTNTSYRAVVAEHLEAAYPKAHFKFYDAAIGGTGSQLGVFRLERDVLRRQPDLVFLDFAANDDMASDNPESLASYESLVRRIIRDGKAPVVLMLFPFQWNIATPDLPSLKRRTAVLQLAQAYHAPVGDAIVHCLDGVKAGRYTVDQLWPYDKAHPGDLGYRQFGDAAWDAYLDGVRRKLTGTLPPAMTYADTYMSWNRVRISSLGPLPAGWSLTHPSLVAAWHDALMTRWTDDMAAASNRKVVVGADGKKSSVPVAVAPLRLRVQAKMLMLFGEGTVKSGRYQVRIDGTTVLHGTPPVDAWDASTKRFGGVVQHVALVTTTLDPSTEHLVEIVPQFLDTEEQELHLESICVAGGAARVTVVP
jgi:lysophospholipase L1-like esterase